MPNNTSKKLNAAQKTHAIYLYALLSAYSKRMQLFVSNKPAFVGAVHMCCEAKQNKSKIKIKKQKKKLNKQKQKT